MMPPNLDESLKTKLQSFKSLLEKKPAVHEVILFGSRARGDADPQSDVDLIVILDDEAGDPEREYVSDCAWEIGFANRLAPVPIVFTREEWEHGLESVSLLGQAVRSEGIQI
jgi:DNA polymerase sigma